MKRWLVTGGAGQLARAIAEAARAEGASVVAPDRHALDVADADALARSLDAEAPDVVVNCAAYTAVDACEEHEAEALRVNGEAPGALARACAGRCLLVHWSTDYVFDGRAGAPLAEDAPVGPLSAYGRSKLAGERAVEAAGGAHLIVRTQWVFGAGACFPRTIQNAARSRPELRVVDDQIGRPSSTDALARGLLQALEAGARGCLHLACEGVASKYDLARETVLRGAARGMNPAVPVLPAPTSEFPLPAERPACAVLSLERARHLGIRMPDWRDALEAWLDVEQQASRTPRQASS